MSSPPDDPPPPAPAPFPPAASNMIQVVDYDEHFNASLNDFLSGRGLTSLGFGYHVASILGAQSSGKSTLLNLLFGTQFQTMNEDDGRYQVTQGVWLGLDSSSQTIVLDLEGTDSRERGEGAVNFERKIALFALALSEVLIVNLWAQDVGRYNAANMDLLKTVMELDLQLFFGSSSSSPDDDGQVINTNRMHKTRLLFVLRDHVASPIDKLCATLRSDVDNIWATITKPDAALGIPVTDLFDIDFFALPHKLLMQQQFDERGAELRRMFVTGEVFEDSYQSGIAADGFSAYANNVWDTIRANRELDIPSQKEMLAHVRCEQIAREAMSFFDIAVTPARSALLLDVGDDVDNEGIGTPSLYNGLVVTLKEATDAATIAYDNAACRYAKQIAAEKKSAMNERIVVSTKALLDAQIALASDSALASVRNALDARGKQAAPWKGWAKARTSLLSSASELFDSSYGGDSIISTLPSDHVLYFAKALVHTARRRLHAAVNGLESKFDTTISDGAREHVVDGFAKTVRPAITSILDADPENDMWLQVSDKVSHAWDAARVSARGAFAENGLGHDKESVEKMVETELRRNCLHEARQATRDAVGSPATMLMRMTKRFDNAFRFDDRGIPRHFGPNDDVDALYVAARDKALSMLDSLQSIQLSGSLTVTSTHDRDLTPGEDDDDEEGHESLSLLADSTRNDLGDQLKRQAGVVFMEAKRAQEAAKITAKVPIWLIFVVLFLGWNEFMAVLRSPVLLLLTVVVAPLCYVAYVVDAPTLLGPAVMNTLRPYVEQAKDTLRQLLDEQPQQQQQQPPGVQTDDSGLLRAEIAGTGALNNSSVGGLANGALSSSVASGPPTTLRHRNSRGGADEEGGSESTAVSEYKKVESGIGGGVNGFVDNESMKDKSA